MPASQPFFWRNSTTYEVFDLLPAAGRIPGLRWPAAWGRLRAARVIVVLPALLELQMRGAGMAPILYRLQAFIPGPFGPNLFLKVNTRMALMTSQGSP